MTDLETSCLPPALKAFIERWYHVDYEYVSYDGAGRPLRRQMPAVVRLKQWLAWQLWDRADRAHALPHVLRQRCSESFSGEGTSLLRAAYTAKAALALLVGRRGWPEGVPEHDSVDVAVYDYRRHYAGWSVTTVTVPEPWWKHFAVRIEQDGDSWY